MRAVWPLRRGHLAQRLKLGLRFDVEGEDAGIERERHLRARLADAGEDDLLRRDLDRERAAKLAFRHHVHAGAEPGQRGKHAEIGVGLDRIADERAGRAGERVGEDPVMALERRRRIAIEGRSDGGGEIGKVDLLGVEHVVVGHAAPVGEMVHWRRRASIRAVYRSRGGGPELATSWWTGRPWSQDKHGFGRSREPRRPQAESPMVSTSTSVKRMRNALPMVVPLSRKPFSGL